MFTGNQNLVVRTKASVFKAPSDLTHYNHRSDSSCPKCGRPVLEDSVTALGVSFHKDCLVCSACNEIIKETDFKQYEDMIFHKNCYNEVFMERCAACHDYVDKDIVIHAISKAFHPECFRCAKCGDKESVKLNYIPFFNRPLCPKCFQEVKSLFPLCVTCSNPILPTDDNYSFFYHNKKYFAHSTCMSCSICYKIPELSEITLYNGKITCKSCIKNVKEHICAECNEPIFDTHCVLDGIYWHPEHFKCSVCGQKMQSNIGVLDDGNLMCRECYDKKLKSCHKCGKNDQHVKLYACGYYWHKKCFRCMNCNKDLSEKQYVNMNGNPMCKECYLLMEAQGKIDRWRRFVK